MPEGLSASEAGEEIGEHASHTRTGPEHRLDRRLSILEAVLLSLVAVLAAYSRLGRSQVGDRVLGIACQGLSDPNEGQPRRSRSRPDPHPGLGVARAWAHAGMQPGSRRPDRSAPWRDVR
jgi:hypothetical protein